MKKFLFTVKIIALLLAVLTPFVATLSIAFLSDSEFDESFVGALDEKIERLMSIKEDKIVIIGGSSVAFGYDSRIIEKYTEMPVVNFGLYAALGTKLMLDLSRDGIKEGDLVIIAPELDAQTLSLYFSASTTLRALDGAPKYFTAIPSTHTLSLLGASWDFAAEKFNYKLFGAPSPEGVYNSKNINEYGDVDYYREANVMTQYYDPNTLIDPTPEILSPDFIDYLNDYIAYCESRGASVVFEYCPMNELGLSAESTEATRAEFEEFIGENINCPIIASNIEDYVYDAGYFYDTNFHLNSAGVKLHTVNVTRDILLELGIPKAVKENIPEPPPLPELDVKFFGEDENAEFFEYTKLANGAYMIVGVKPEYLGKKTLTVPLGYGGYKVSAIGKDAFLGSSVEKLILTEKTNVTLLSNGCFNGAQNLSELWIYYPTEEDILPPASFTGVGADFKVYVPRGSNYSVGYYWSERGLTFEYIPD